MTPHVKWLAHSLLVLCILGCQKGDIKPFTTDGCSAFVDGTYEQNELWLKCCYEHDLTYWQGGTYVARLESDKALHQCVAKVGEPAVAMLMLAGVRIGGSPYWPTTFRWGYGWPYTRGYKPLTEYELNKVRKALMHDAILRDSTP